MRKTQEKMRNLQRYLDSMNTNRGDDVDVQSFEGNGGKGAKGKGRDDRGEDKKRDRHSDKDSKDGGLLFYNLKK